MKHALRCFAGCAVAGLTAVAGAQEAVSLTRLPSGAAPSLNLSDRSLRDGGSASAPGNPWSLHESVVAFDTRYDGARKKLGLSLAGGRTGPLALAYDPESRSLIAQWRSVYTSAAGQSFQYQAFVGASGTVNFTIRSNF